MRIFYINLDRRPDRRAFMERQFAALGLAAERVSAVTPAEIDPDLIARRCDRSKPGWLAPSELGATHSHMKVWRALVASGESCALVLEDDATLSRRLPAFLAAAPDDLGGFDIVRLETRDHFYRLSPKPDAVWAGAGLHRPLVYECGCAGYLVTARTARRLLAAPDIFAVAVDDVMFDMGRPGHILPGLRQTVPALCVTLDRGKPSDRLPLVKGDIAQDRNARFIVMAAPLGVGGKIVRETRRVLGQLRRAPRWAWYLSTCRGPVPRLWPQPPQAGGPAWRRVHFDPG